MRVAVFGLGEAGSLFAGDLVAAGVETMAFDPAPVSTPAGVTRTLLPGAAVDGVDLVIALTGASDARTARSQVAGSLPPNAIYADASTSPPDLKRELAATGGDYVDVALMGVVVGRGLRTPAVASGPASSRYADLLAPYGVPVDAIGGEAGDAVTRKLLRSVVMKGLAGLVIEAVRAGEACGLADWVWNNVVEELTAADGVLVSRLVNGTARHARRRLEEMEATAALLESVGVEPLLTMGTVASLRRALADGVPAVPPDPQRGPSGQLIE